MNKIKFATTTQTGHLDTWGQCTRCGSDDISGDAWQAYCPRCQQLAALEAEIGRAVIGYDFVHYALGERCYEPNLSHAYMQLCMDKANLIARWRELHAAGAEGGE